MTILRSPQETEGGGETSEVWGDEGQQEEGQGAGEEGAGEEGEAAGEGEGEGEGEAAAASTVKPGLSEDDIANILKKAGMGERAAAAPAKQPEMSPEELKRAMNVFEVDKNAMCKLFRLDPDDVNDEQVAAMNGFISNIVKQSVTMSGFHVQAIQRQLMEQLSPALALARAQQEESLKTEFFEKYSDLKDYEPLLREIKDRLQGQGFSGTKEEAFETIATQARAILKSLPGVGNGAKPGQSQAQQQQTQTRRQMSTVSAGGQSGAGGGKPKGSSKSGPEAVWS